MSNVQKIKAFASIYFENALVSNAVRRIVPYKGMEEKRDTAEWLAEKKRQENKSKMREWFNQPQGVEKDEWYGGETSTFNEEFDTRFRPSFYISAERINTIAKELVEKAKKAGRSVYIDIDEELPEHDEELPEHAKELGLSPGSRPNNLKIRISLELVDEFGIAKGLWDANQKLITVFLPHNLLHTEKGLKKVVNTLAHELGHAVDVALPKIENNGTAYQIMGNFLGNLNMGLSREDAFNETKQSFEWYGNWGDFIETYREALMTLPLEEIRNMDLLHWSKTPSETFADGGKASVVLKEPNNWTYLKNIWLRRPSPIPSKDLLRNISDAIEAILIQTWDWESLYRGFRKGYINGMAEWVCKELWKEYSEENKDTANKIRQSAITDGDRVHLVGDPSKTGKILYIDFDHDDDQAEAEYSVIWDTPSGYMINRESLPASSLVKIKDKAPEIIEDIEDDLGDEEGFQRSALNSLALYYGGD